MFLTRLSPAQITEALRRANLPAETPVLGIFYDHAGGRIEIRTPGAVVVVRPEQIAEAVTSSSSPDANRVLFPKTETP